MKALDALSKAQIKPKCNWSCHLISTLIKASGNQWCYEKESAQISKCNIVKDHLFTTSMNPVINNCIYMKSSHNEMSDIMTFMQWKSCIKWQIRDKCRKICQPVVMRLKRPPYKRLKSLIFKSLPCLQRCIFTANLARM